MRHMMNWIHILRTGNSLQGVPLGWASRWLLITRACVFSMTILSACIGGLLAAMTGAFDAFAFALVVLGLVLAHASNNMVNDYFDMKNGVDTAGYPRVAYAPHPILSNLVGVRGLWTAIIVCNLIDLGIALWLSVSKGWGVLGFAIVGLAVSVFYVAPPLKLKHRGLGEAAIFFIWGPLMITGTFYAMGGSLLGPIWLASIPYGIAVAAVVMGKHIDKVEKDRERGVGTLPVVLGERGGRHLMLGLILFFYAGVAALVALRIFPWPALLVLLSVPRGLRVARVLTLSVPATPAEAFGIARDAIPRDLREQYDPARGGNTFPIWPLWFVVWGVWWVRRAGALLAIGLAATLAIPRFFGGFF